MRRCLIFVSLLLALTSCGVTPPAEQITPTAATGKFYIVGKDIIDPNGNVFYPIGANVAVKFTEYPYVFEGGNGGVNTHLESVKAWKLEYNPRHAGVRATPRPHLTSWSTGLRRRLKRLPKPRL